MDEGELDTVAAASGVNSLLEVASDLDGPIDTTADSTAPVEEGSEKEENEESTENNRAKEAAEDSVATDGGSSEPLDKPEQTDDAPLEPVKSINEESQDTTVLPGEETTDGEDSLSVQEDKAIDEEGPPSDESSKPPDSSAGSEAVPAPVVKDANLNESNISSGGDISPDAISVSPSVDKVAVISVAEVAESDVSQSTDGNDAVINPTSEPGAPIDAPTDATSNDFQRDTASPPQTIDEEEQHPTFASNSLRDSVTMEVVNLSGMNLAQLDPGPSPSPPLEKREELWSKFPELDSFPVAENNDSDNVAATTKIENTPPPAPPRADSGLVLLRELVEGSNPGMTHTDDVLSCMLRCHESDVHKTSAVITNLLKLADAQGGDDSMVEPSKAVDELEAEWMHLTSEEDQDHDKKISIDSNEIGITVENVLERTVVHLVKEGSAAEQLGVKAGVLLLAVHNSPTFHLSHFETVDALKRAPRPAKLRFRPLPPTLLVEMRARMHSLVVQTSAHHSIQRHLHKFPTSMKAPCLGDETQLLKFTPPPPPPKSESGSELGHRPVPAAHVVTDWACEQLRLVCQVYTMALSKSISDEKSKKQQMLMIDILSNFYESCRRPTRSKTSASHTHKLGSLTQLLNSLVFGLPDISPRRVGTPGGNYHRQVDWRSSEMKPFLFNLIDIACALLESDCDTPVMYQMAPPSSPDVFFDASLEPVLNDGAAGALLVVVFRALFHHEPDNAVPVSSSISASLASTKCERGRISACRLVLEVYYQAPLKFVSEGLLLRGIATRLLVQSQEPNVRAAAVTSIQRLGKYATLNDLDWLNLLCETAASDDDTMVRRGGFEFSLRLLHRLPDLFPSTMLSFDGIKDADIDLHLLRCRIVAIVQRLVEDLVPSVRHAVAAHCASLCTLLGGGRLGQQWSTWIVDTLHTFLRDDDAPVRSAAIDAIPFVTLLLRGFAHYYVYHANMHPSATKDIEQDKEDGAQVAAVNRVISWNDVASLIRECIAKSGATEVVVQLSVSSMKRTASMLLPALLKLSQEAPEDVRCKVAGAVGQFFVHIQDEVLLLDLGKSKADVDSGKDTREEFKKHAWKTLSQDLVCNLIAPLIKAIMKDQYLQVVATLFTELASLPQSFSWLDAEGGGRGSQPMSSIYLLTEELLSDSRSVIELHDAGANKARHWATAEIVPDELLKSFVVDLESMTGHRDWRNRAVAVRGVLSFASFATTSDMQSRLAQICVRMMNDKVHAVRLAAAESMCLTGLIHHDLSLSNQSETVNTNEDTATSDAGSTTSDSTSLAIGDWCESVVIPQLYDLMQRAVARERQLALYMIQILVSLNIVTRDVTIGVLLPLLLNAAQDVVSNVRLSVAKTLYYFMRGNTVKSFGQRADNADDLVGVLAKHSELHRCIDRLCADEDLDVNYHARQAKTTLDSFLLPNDNTPTTASSN